MSDLHMPDFAFDASSLVIFGGGGQGKCVIDMVRATGVYRAAGIIDDGISPGTEILGVPVLGGVNILPELHQRAAPGGECHWWDRERCAAGRDLSHPGRCRFHLPVASFILPPGSSPQPQSPDGVQVLAKSYVGSAARVGYGTLINAGVIVSHDCDVGQCVNLSPGAALAGGVRVEDFAQIGMNATVNVNVTIGAGARVGNGATVKADVPPGGRVYAGTIWPVENLIHKISTP
jgi:acetyltransferase EpsM